MQKPKIIADSKIPFLPGVLEAMAEMEYAPGKDISREMVHNADALIIRTRTKCNEELLKDSTVKFIATATIGYDHIDQDYCNKHQIEYTNAPGCNSSSVEQYIVSALFELALTYYLQLQDMTLGIVGVGNVGSKVSGAARKLGMKVLLNDPPRARQEGMSGFVALDEIRKKADIITFHVPLNREGEDLTYRMVNEAFFKSLEKPIFFLNTSRGEIVDEKALKNAIKNKNVRAAVIDVWNDEPYIDRELLELAEFATAHIAGYSLDGKANGTMMSVRAISRFFGLGIDDWKPSYIPEPSQSKIYIDCTDMERLEIMAEVYRSTYNIKKDHDLLMKDPDQFEELRGSYRIRREPHTFSVKLINNPWREIDETMELLGFSVLETDCFC